MSQHSRVLVIFLLLLHLIPCCLRCLVSSQRHHTSQSLALAFHTPCINNTLPPSHLDALRCWCFYTIHCFPPPPTLLPLRAFAAHHTWSHGH
ncbi:hypothetical protein N657DRAFT_272719 [Parathielavia appendiculata]|uniref:Secreted protein n=1 Tax=Parathielavia appendiculata TaxID=2587402 RepID=A0AAN6U5T6_9PEZI|nr:hypothetical protein N657DRAFT_272719 [Parathielavia appendiculata]